MAHHRAYDTCARACPTHVADAVSATAIAKNCLLFDTLDSTEEGGGSQATICTRAPREQPRARRVSRCQPVRRGVDTAGGAARLHGA